MSGGDRRRADGALVAALAGGSTVADAAKLAGVGEATVYRRLRGAAFRKQVADARSELLTSAIGTLARISSAAATTLALLMAKTETSAIRLGAARAILGLVTDLRQAEELEVRVADLETRLTTETKR